MNHFENISMNQEAMRGNDRLNKTISSLNLKLDNEGKLFSNEKMGEKNQERIVSPELLNKYFESKGFKIEKPLALVNNEIKTFFTISGIQKLDPIIHKERMLPENKFFIAQPVLRTQFLETVTEGSLTSFNNISTIMVNEGYEKHVEAFEQWFEMLTNNGFLEKDIFIQVSKNKNRWGEKEFYNEVISVLYKGIEIGEASYIDSMPQDTRPDLSISDIGFGVERMNYSLTGKTFDSEKENSVPVSVVDFSRSLILLAASGVKPSNKAQGYRARLFSKRFVNQNIEHMINPKEFLDISYDEWSKWIDLPISKEESLKIVMKEYDRNFNREILNGLQAEGNNIEIDINQITESFVRQIKTSGFKDLLLLNSLYEKYPK
jgi:alanyl-tRNA synthetase